MKLSVIIPALNSPFIDRTIRSIYRSTFKGAIEIIIVGQDKYNLIPKGYDNLQFIQTKEPLTAPQARNLGIDYAEGDIIFFTDADCEVDPECIQTHYTLQKNGWDIVGGAVEIRRGNYWGLCDNISSFHFLLPDMVRGERLFDWPATLNLSIKKRLFLEVSKFDESLNIPPGEDMDILLRMQEKGYRIFWEPKAIVAHLNTRNSLGAMLRHCHFYGNVLPLLLSKHPDKILRRKNSIFWKSRFIFLLSAPFKSIVFSLNLFIRHRRYLFRFIHTLPGIILYKLVWHYSVFKAMKNNRI